MGKASKAVTSKTAAKAVAASKAAKAHGPAIKKLSPWERKLRDKNEHKAKNRVAREAAKNRLKVDNDLVKVDDSLV